MANWMTSAEISARYIVGEQKLLAYARRGNMPMFRGPDGTTRFDESFVAQLFRPRGRAAVPAMTASGKPTLGVLGVTRLGDQPGVAAATASTRVSVPPARSPDPAQTRRPVVRSATAAERTEERLRRAAG